MCRPGSVDIFIETRGVKYDKAVECLMSDRVALFTYYDFPAGTASICNGPRGRQGARQSPQVVASALPRGNSPVFVMAGLPERALGGRASDRRVMLLSLAGGSDTVIKPGKPILEFHRRD